MFDGDVDDNLAKVIFEMIQALIGRHEISVEFSGSDGKTHTFSETVVIE